jgi:hypothetical protein
MTGPVNAQTYTNYEPVSLSPAPGWRAAYIHSPGDGGGWSGEPLIAWGVFEVTERPCRGSTAPEQHHGREIYGVVFGDGCPGPAEEVSNFWRYIPPGEPDPTAEEVAARQAEVRDLAERKARRAQR